MVANMTEEIFNKGKAPVCLPERRAETGRLLPRVINCQTRESDTSVMHCYEAVTMRPVLCSPSLPTLPPRVITAGCTLRSIMSDFVA